MKLFTLLQALDTLQTNAPSLDREVDGVHNDTRRMKPGDMFVAIPGTDMDGHCYIRQALDIGASMIVSERPLDSEVPHVVVPDARAALARLAACMAGNPAGRMTMIGVTGTKGKTSVTHIIKDLIERVTGERVGLVGTNHILTGEMELPSERTTPDAVALHGVFARMADAGCKVCVMEVSSHALVQSRVAGIRYAVGAFTNLSHEHLDYHRDMDGYFAAKQKLFSQSDASVINADDPWGQRLLLDTLPNPYAVKLSDACEIELKPAGVEFEWEGVRTGWGTPGLFSVRNALLALTCCRALGLPPAELARALPLVPPVKGRMEPVPSNRGFTIIIDYAHTPDSMENALTTVRSFTEGRLIALFGCGGDRDTAKRPMMGGIAQRLADLCFVTSDNPRTESPEAIISGILTGMDAESGSVRVEPDRRKAVFAALREAKEGDVVLLLGKGHETYQEINGVKNHMDEREIVAEFFGAVDNI